LTLATLVAWAMLAVLIAWFAIVLLATFRQLDGEIRRASEEGR
jgi:Flp pilus assembly pilin Flp